MLGRAGTSGYEPYQKCTYLPYTYTITVALIYYNTCASDVILRQLVLCWVHRSYRGGGVN